MRQIRGLLFYWLPPIVLMIFIFSLSSRQRIGISEEFIINFIIFKTLHVMEYGVLYFFFFRAFNAYSTEKTSRAFIYAGIATLLFAISDETHQTFVPTREGSSRDIFIDTIGIGLCFMYTKTNLKKLRIFL